MRLFLALFVATATVANAFSPQGVSSRIKTAVYETPQKAVYDNYGEESRQYRRTVYTHDDWVKHRSTDRFARNLASIVKSGVYKNLAKEVMATTSVATFVCLWNTLCSGYAGLGGEMHPAVIDSNVNLMLSLPLAPFTVSSPSLGLLLVFRTNTSYQRWDEARKNWGMNINHTRDLVRLASSYYDRTGQSQKKIDRDLKRVAYATWSFVRAMKRHLSPEWEDEDAFKADLKEKLPPKQAQMIIDAAHRPNRALQDLSFAIEALPMHFMRKNEIHRAATIFEDNLGSSERLLTSPVPLVYSRHTSRFLSAWLLLLPFGLYDQFANTWNHAAMIPATAAISIFLFGIEELATQLEEPFTILPMQGFCDKIFNWCTEIVSWRPNDNNMFEVDDDESQEHAVPTSKRSWWKKEQSAHSENLLNVSSRRASRGESYDLLEQETKEKTWLERNAPVERIPDSLLGTGNFFGGILSDYRLRSFSSDFFVSWKVKSAAIFMFCATATSTIALGDVAFRETDGRIGITEYLMLQGVAGTLHALFSACPLPILRPTGPITAFVVDLFGVAERVQVDYYQLLSWVGLWVGLFLMVIAAFDLSRYIVLCTRFLHDIYAVFVCTIYISDGLIGVIERFQQTIWIQAFFASYLAMFCIVFSLLFYYADRSVILNQRWRHTISDYAVPLSVAICIGISHAASDNVQVNRIVMPRNFEPTYPLYDGGVAGDKRDWFQGPGFDWITVGVSLVAAVPIVALFYIDHLFSCILGQKPELGLQKGEFYHSSMFITGLCNLVLPSFGLPFVTASLPHSPQFTKALTDYDKSKSPWKPEYVHESRVAPLAVYALCFCGLVVPSMLEVCPEGVVNGILAFVGLQGILPGTGNQLIDRCVLLVTAPSEFPKEGSAYCGLPWQRIHLYTFIQLSCLAACWGMRFTGPFSLAFPLVIVGFVPLRLLVLPILFSTQELNALDSEGDIEGVNKSEAHDYVAHEDPKLV